MNRHPRWYVKTPPKLYLLPPLGDSFHSLMDVVLLHWSWNQFIQWKFGSETGNLKIWQFHNGFDLSHIATKPKPPTNPPSSHVSITSIRFGSGALGWHTFYPTVSNVHNISLDIHISLDFLSAIQHSFQCTRESSRRDSQPLQVIADD